MRISERVLKSVASESELHNASLCNRRAKQDGDDVDHGLGDPPQDEAVHEQAEIDGFESAQKGGGLAAIANLDKLHVGEDLRTAPVPREEEHRQHTADAQAPPDPVAGDTRFGHQAAYQ